MPRRKQTPKQPSTQWLAGCLTSSVWNMNANAKEQSNRQIKNMVFLKLKVFPSFKHKLKKVLLLFPTHTQLRENEREKQQEVQIWRRERKSGKMPGRENRVVFFFCVRKQGFGGELLRLSWLRWYKTLTLPALSQDTGETMKEKGRFGGKEEKVDWWIIR